MADPTAQLARSTADEVIAGVDLSGKRFLVTGCRSGLGFETMNALAANGATVLGLARSPEVARAACRLAGPSCIPVGCDLSDLGSVAAAVERIRVLDAPLDGIVANAAVAHLPASPTASGIEPHFLVNHLSHFALLEGLRNSVRDGTGRIVIVSGDIGIHATPAELGAEFDDPACRPDDGGAASAYARSKLAVALYAQELSRRLAGRGIAVNTVDPGRTRGTLIDRHAGGSALRALARLFMQNVHRGAATQTLLAASPRVAGISGEHWRACRITPSNPLTLDATLAKRLWSASQRLLSAAHSAFREPAAA